MKGIRHIDKELNEKQRKFIIRFLNDFYKLINEKQIRSRYVEDFNGKTYTITIEGGDKLNLMCHKCQHSNYNKKRCNMNLVQLETKKICKYFKSESEVESEHS